MKKMYVHFGSKFGKYKNSQKNGSKTKMWDVGCDRMVFAINSKLFLIEFNSFFNKWSLDQGQKTINPLDLFRVSVEDT